MEQHPIPRDITGFKFKLVGTMTLKQFGYVAGGAVLGYIFFKMPLGIFSFLLAGLFWFLGFALAFIPIQERPLDRWLMAFIKSVYSPTQYLWQKTPPEIKILNLSPSAQKKKSAHLPQYLDSRRKLENYLEKMPASTEQTLDQKEADIVSQTMAFFDQPRSTTPLSQFTKRPVRRNTVSQPTPKITGIAFKKPQPLIPPPVKAEIKEEKKAPVQTERPMPKKDFLREQQLEQKIQNLKKQLELKTLSRARFLEVSQQLTQSLDEKRKLEEKLETLAKKVAEKRETVVPQAATEETEPRVKMIALKLAPKKGIPHLPQKPNIVSGIIKDNQGNLLPGVIVTVKDETGMTVRALKTNPVGLFVSATPLINGAYTLEIEDPQKRYQFDIIKISLKGELYSPLEILAKGERERTREFLTKELFGKN